MRHTDTLTPTDALKAYGLDWGIQTQPLKWVAPGGTDTLHPVDLPTGHRMTYRTDTLAPLGVVSKRYRPIDNAAIATAIEAALPDPECIVAGGEYRKGKRIWIQADLGEMKIGGVDPVAKYVLFYSDHDGTGSLRISGSTFRMGCFNQLNAATKDHQTVSIRHTGNTGGMTPRIEAAIMGVSQWLTDFEALAADLSRDKAIDGGWMAEYFQRAYLETCSTETRGLLLVARGGVESREADGHRLRGGVESRDADDRRERAEKAAEKAAAAVADMARNYADADGGKMAHSIRGSRWHAFNAATEWVDHGGRYGAEALQLGDAARSKVAMLETARTM